MSEEQERKQEQDPRMRPPTNVTTDTETEQPPSEPPFFDPPLKISALRPAPRSRLISRGTVCHQGDRQSPLTPFEHTFSTALETDEQPYKRPGNFVADENWKQLDAGWLAESGASLVCVRNDEGGGLSVIPTSQQRAETAAKIVEIAFTPVHDSTNVWEVLPGQVFQGRPSNLANLFVRCRQGKARCTLVVFPK